MAQVPASSILFARGVIARLEIWPTLRVAVQESWGGPSSAQKRSWLSSVVVDTFETTNPPPDDQYIEELLLQILTDEFDVTVEDGSAEIVAVDLVKMWDETRQGKQTEVLKFEEMADKTKGKKVDFVEKVQSDDEDWEDEGDDDENEDDVEMDEAPQLLQPEQEHQRRDEPEVDEDGFTVVKSKGKGRR